MRRCLRERKDGNGKRGGESGWVALYSVYDRGFV